jgi:hypothetical protein
VSSPELSSIEGLADKHLRALARHGVTDLPGLVDADREVIHRAMASLRPRPSRDQIAGWQDEARSMLAATVADAPGALDDSAWQTAASFVVVFLQRRAGDGWERRVEAERTEVEPERNPQAWPGWAIAPVFDWMLDQLGQDGDAESAPAVETPEPAVAESPAATTARERPALRIDSAVLIDASGPESALAAGAVAASTRDLVVPARAAFTVGGAPPKARLLAVARVLRPDGPGWNVADPVAVPDSGRVEFDLSAVPAGEHEMSLIAWAPDATAKPASVELRLRLSGLDG